MAPDTFAAFPGTLSTDLIGRSQEVARVSKLLSEPSTRVVTLCGRAGVGKTRLALELTSRFSAGALRRVAAVALPGISDPSLVMPAVGSALGTPLVPGSTTGEAVARQVGSDELPLVVDNFRAPPAVRTHPDSATRGLPAGTAPGNKPSTAYICTRNMSSK